MRLLLIAAPAGNETVGCIVVVKPEPMISSMCFFTDIVHRDLKLENILVEKSVGDDSGRINIKVRWQRKGLRVCNSNTSSSTM